MSSPNPKGIQPPDREHKHAMTQAQAFARKIAKVSADPAAVMQEAQDAVRFDSVNYDFNLPSPAEDGNPTLTIVFDDCTAVELEITGMKLRAPA